jgi:hypothetical protein
MKSKKTSGGVRKRTKVRDVVRRRRMMEKKGRCGVHNWTDEQIIDFFLSSNTSLMRILPLWDDERDSMGAGNYAAVYPKKINL